MANPLSQLENLAEQLVEGTLARVLRARLHPIQVARHIARAMEDGQIINPQGDIVVPNEYQVALHPDDLAAMTSYKEVLETELVHYVSSLARQAGATMIGRPRVFLSSSSSVPPKQVRIQARLVSARSNSLDLTHTQEMPAVANLEQRIPSFVLFDGYRRMPISEAIVTIGRSLENDVILDDKRVSRRHAQLRRRYEQYVLYDLDSTGGTTVNGIRIREAVLQPDDIIAFAGIKVRFERADAVPFAQDVDLDPAATRILQNKRGTEG
jgi:hypothetical protein